MSNPTGNPDNQRKPTAYRGKIIRFRANPFEQNSEQDQSLELIDDGLLICASGKFDYVGDFAAGKSRLDQLSLTAESVDGYICPGFIDAHCHYPQQQIIGAYGKQLIDWLNRYTFPTEMTFADPEVCRRESQAFMQSCIRNGVTTAAVYCTVHPASVEALATAAAEIDMRILAGKVLMDRNAPAALCDTAQSGYDDSKQLIDKWHGKGRFSYAVTPRFAPTSTAAQLEAAGALLRERPEVYCQTHVAENKAEVAWVAELFPEARSYLDVYQQFGLLNERTILGHAIYLDQTDWALMAERQSVVAHCPTSNLFIGSGLFPMERVLADQRIGIALASDIGGGTNLCPFATLNETYKIAQLQNYSIPASRLLWLHTAGAAQALSMGDRIGNISTGMEADFVVLNPEKSADIQHRLRTIDSIEELLFVVMMMGDNRLITATWIAGQRYSAEP